MNDDCIKKSGERFGISTRPTKDTALSRHMIVEPPGIVAMIQAITMITYSQIEEDLPTSMNFNRS